MVSQDHDFRNFHANIQSNSMCYPKVMNLVNALKSKNQVVELFQKFWPGSV